MDTLTLGVSGRAKFSMVPTTATPAMPPSTRASSRYGSSPRSERGSSLASGSPMPASAGSQTA
jgi:hypothetical protein